MFYFLKSQAVAIEAWSYYMVLTSSRQLCPPFSSHPLRDIQVSDGKRNLVNAVPADPVMLSRVVE